MLYSIHTVDSFQIPTLLVGRFPNCATKTQFVLVLHSPIADR